MIALRLVLDTNIIVSAALKPDGLQRSVLLVALQKPARLYMESSTSIAQFWPGHGFVSARVFAGSFCES
jgi:hypothetical protein